MITEVKLEDWKNEWNSEPPMFPTINISPYKDEVGLYTNLSLCKEGNCYIFPIRMDYKISIENYLSEFYKVVEGIQNQLKTNDVNTMYGYKSI